MLNPEIEHFLDGMELHVYRTITGIMQILNTKELKMALNDIVAFARLPLLDVERAINQLTLYGYLRNITAEMNTETKYLHLVDTCIQPDDLELATYQELRNLILSATK